MSIPDALRNWKLWMPVVGTVLAAAFAAGGVQAINAQKAEAAVNKAQHVEMTVTERLNNVDSKLDRLSDRVDDVYTILIEKEPRLRK